MEGDSRRRDAGESHRLLVVLGSTRPKVAGPGGQRGRWSCLREPQREQRPYRRGYPLCENTEAPASYRPTRAEANGPILAWSESPMFGGGVCVSLLVDSSSVAPPWSLTVRRRPWGVAAPPEPED